MELTRAPRQQKLTKEQRQAAWTRIQAEAPELAEWLTAINTTFGKPKSVTVSINGEKVL